VTTKGQGRDPNMLRAQYLKRAGDRGAVNFRVAVFDVCNNAGSLLTV